MEQRKENERSISLTSTKRDTGSTLGCRHDSPTRDSVVVRHGCLGGWDRTEVLCLQCGNELEYRA